jgi:hypothetical protein
VILMDWYNRPKQDILHTNKYILRTGRSFYAETA